MADAAHVVYGLHAVEAVLDRRIGSVASAVILDVAPKGRLAEIVRRLETAGVPIERARRVGLDRLTGDGVHQGIAIRVPAPREHGIGVLEDLVQARATALRLLVLDQIEDPRNLGACLRTADAAAVDAVVVPKARSAKLSAAALKVAAGAAETVPLIVVPNLARTLRWLTDAGIRLVGTDSEGELPLFDATLAAPVAIVLGAEGRGLRRLTREACDELVRIPMHGAVESLNVSVAAGIMLYEMLRQAD